MPAAGSPYAWPWPKVRLAVLQRDGWLCRVAGPTCKGRATTVDHVVPLSRGGARLDPGNLQAACRGCQTWRTHETRVGCSAAASPSRALRTGTATAGGAGATTARLRHVEALTAALGGSQRTHRRGSGDGGGKPSGGESGTGQSWGRDQGQSRPPRVSGEPPFLVVPALVVVSATRVRSQPGVLAELAEAGRTVLVVADDDLDAGEGDVVLWDEDEAAVFEVADVQFVAVGALGGLVEDEGDW